jgi:hypothetical protein
MSNIINGCQPREGILQGTFNPEIQVLKPAAQENASGGNRTLLGIPIWPNVFREYRCSPMALPQRSTNPSAAAEGNI